MFIYPRKRQSNSFLRCGPPNAIAAVSDSGWINESLWMEYLKHFAQTTRCSKEHPVLLIIDNHGSHSTLEAVEFARENGIIILTLYPHTSHKMQPLDVSVYGPFKRAYANAMNDWMTNDVGKRFTIHEVAECSANAINIAFTQPNIISGFKSTGVCPFNANVFGPSDFLGSEPTDVPLDRATSDYSTTPTTTAPQTSEETNPSEPVPIEPTCLFFACLYSVCQEQHDVGDPDDWVKCCCAGCRQGWKLKPKPKPENPVLKEILETQTETDTYLVKMWKT